MTDNPDLVEALKQAGFDTTDLERQVRQRQSGDGDAEALPARMAELEAQAAEQTAPAEHAAAQQRTEGEAFVEGSRTALKANSVSTPRPAPPMKRSTWDSRKIRRASSSRICEGRPERPASASETPILRSTPRHAASRSFGNGSLPRTPRGRT